MKIFSKNSDMTRLLDSVPIQESFCPVFEMMNFLVLRADDDMQSYLGSESWYIELEAASIPGCFRW